MSYLETTKNPGNETETTYIKPLKDAGFEDRAILDGTMVVA